MGQNVFFAPGDCQEAEPNSRDAAAGSVGTLVLDEDLTVLTTNRTFRDFFNLHENDLVERNVSSLLESTLGECLDDPDRFVEALDSTDGQRTHHVLPEGNLTERWLTHTSTVIEQGALQGNRIETFIDVTPYVTTNRKLKQNAEHYHGIVKHSPDGIFVFDSNGKFLEVNASAVEMTGYDGETLTSKTIFDLVPDEYRTEAREQFRKVSESESISLDVPVATKTNERRFWTVGVIRLSDEEFVGFTQDITKRREIEKTLREAEKRFRLMAENSEAVIWLSDPDFKELHFINSRYESVFDGDREKVLEAPMNVLEDIHPDDHDTVKESIAKLVDGQEVQAEYRINPGADFGRWAHAWGVPVENDGEVIYLLGSVRDVTDRKERELKLREVARTDELTKLPNRKSLLERLKDEVRRTRRYDKPLSVAIFDVDNFKAINDTHGHLTGDKVLRRLGDLLKDSIRDVDHPGRYGGEEFAVVFPETPLEEARTVAERIRRRVANKTLLVDDEEIATHWSGGVTAWGEDDQSVEDLVGRADEALYAAKRTGRNRIVTR